MIAAPEPTSAPCLRARGLRKQFGTLVAVDGIDLEVGQGECFGLLGPNGAGKTSTLRMLMGASPMSGGELEVFGLPIPEQARRVRARMGVVPQFDNLDPDFTVAENLRMYGRYFGLDHRVMTTRLPELLEFAALADRTEAPVSELSGGMRRRLTLARALVNDPELIVLDEPTTGLDPQVRQLLWARLARLREQGRTLLLTTHYLDEAERLCDRLVIMDHGRILAAGSPREMIRTHVEPEVIELRLDGQRPESEWQRLGDLAAATGARVERIGLGLACYTREPRGLLQVLEHQGELTWLHRPANLEDVFLRLTGRDLRD